MKCKDCFEFKAFSHTPQKGLCGSAIVYAESEACKHFDGFKVLEFPEKTLIANGCDKEKNNLT